ncbi:hypothetical protein LCGC14_1941360, partial [marine sediment metagenome]
MIAVVGLLLTTGGYNAPQVSDSQDVVQDTQMVVQGRVRGLNVEKGQIDVQLHTQAHLQASGGTPTPTTGEPSTAERLGTLRDKVVQGVEVVPPSRVGTVETTICAYPWPQGCDYWVAVASCESTLGLDPWAYDVRNPYTGLFQIWGGHGYGYEWLKDDANNT